MIDSVDAQILSILQDNARTSNAEIARQVGFTASAVLERIKKLEKRGVIRGYAAVVDPAALELPVLAYVFVRLSLHRGAREVGRRLALFDAVQEVAHLTGEDCFMLKTRTADTEALEHLVMAVNDIDQVAGTRTVIAFRTMKETLGLPVEAREK